MVFDILCERKCLCVYRFRGALSLYVYVSEYIYECVQQRSACVCAHICEHVYVCAYVCMYWSMCTWKYPYCRNWVHRRVHSVQYITKCAGLYTDGKVIYSSTSILLRRQVYICICIQQHCMLLHVYGSYV